MIVEIEEKSHCAGHSIFYKEIAIKAKFHLSPKSTVSHIEQISYNNHYYLYVEIYSFAKIASHAKSWQIAGFLNISGRGIGHKRRPWRAPRPIAHHSSDIAQRSPRQAAIVYKIHVTLSHADARHHHR